MATNDTKTMTAEEIDSLCKSALNGYDLSGEEVSLEVTLKMVAVQADRVPGLEADVQRLERIREDYVKTTERLGSERDAAQHEVERQMKRGDAWRAATSRAESERDAARNDAASATVLQEDAEKERDSLRERVATLEAQVQAKDAQLAAVNTALDDMGVQVTREVDALQARVKVLESEVERMENIDRQRRGQVSRLQDTIQKHQQETPETSQPPPAPAQAPSTPPRLLETIAAKELGELRAAAEATRSPTPQGLREGQDGKQCSFTMSGVRHERVRCENKAPRVCGFCDEHCGHSGKGPCATPAPDLKRLEDALYHEDAKGNGEPL